MRRVSTPPHRQSGMSVLEALVALSLMAMVLLGALALVFAAPKIEHRLEAHQQVLRLMETQIEVLRAGPSVPGDGEIDLSLLPRPAKLGARELRMWIKVEADAGRNLRLVTLSARYVVEGRQYDRTLVTRIFQPGGGGP